MPVVSYYIQKKDAKILHEYSKPVSTHNIIGVFGNSSNYGGFLRKMLNNITSSVLKSLYIISVAAFLNVRTYTGYGNMAIKNSNKLAATIIAVLMFIISSGAFASAEFSASWSVMDSGTSADLYAVWGADNTHIFAAGQSGTILYYDGTSWSAMTSGTANNAF